MIMEYKNEKFIEEFKNIVSATDCKKILFVCGREYDRYGYRKALDGMGVEVVPFTDFEPCPEVSSVKKGVEVFKNNSCDFIVTVGGGSAMDTAKAIKLFAEADVKILAVPTTAGTGAEVTRFAVLYNKGDKQSVRSYDIIPDYQVFDYSSLVSLPYNQKVVTALDAFCHAVEAFWSKDATDESREYSAKALDLFDKYFHRFLNGDSDTLEPMMKCSELAGRAINIAQTTACHAFSYKLHKIKGFYHGQAVAVCLVYIWKYMQEKGDSYLKALLKETEKVSHTSPTELEREIKELGLLDDLTMTPEQLEETVNGVDVNRLSNHPMKFSQEDIRNIYESFIKKDS